MATAKLIAKKKATRSDGTTPIYIQYCYNSDEKSLLKTGYYIKPKFWDNRKSRIHNSFPGDNNYNDAQDFNTEIEGKLNKVNKIIAHCKQNLIDPTIKTMQEQFYNESWQAQKKANDFWSLFNKFYIDRSLEVDVVTLGQYDQFKETLEKYEEKRGIKVSFNKMNYSFYKDYVRFLLFEFITRLGAVGYAKTTAGKHIKNLRTFLNYCFDHEEIERFSLKKFKVLTEDTYKIYLTEEEIDKIYNLKFEEKDKHLEKYRDMFVLACETGLRISDFKTLTEDKIKAGRIHVIANKNLIKHSDELKIPIREKTKKILEKYENKLPEITDVNFNEYIKKVGDLAEINESLNYSKKIDGKNQIISSPKFELITAHTARRSFATNEFLRGTHPYLIMAITGHKKESTFMKYLRLDAEVYARKMEEIWAERLKNDNNNQIKHYKNEKGTINQEI